MSWNNWLIALLFAFLPGCCIHQVNATEVCPLRHGVTLRFVDVFDGSPEELATLIPDKATEQSGYWQLGYVYDAGRFVTIRCKYSDGKSTDVKLASRVNRCDYTIDSKKTLALHCE